MEASDGHHYSFWNAADRKKMRQQQRDSIILLCSSSDSGDSINKAALIPLHPQVNDSTGTSLPKEAPSFVEA